MKKLLLLFALILGTVGAWAEESVTWIMGTPVSTITSGKYVLMAMSNNGTGPCYYNGSEGGNRFYRYDVSKSALTTGSVVESEYLWNVELLSDNKITIKWANDEAKFFIKDGAKNQNFQGSEMAQLIPESHTIAGKDYFALTLEDTNIGYIHANAPGGNPNLSYWNSYGDDGTCVKFTFYPVEEATSVVNVIYNFIYDGKSKGTETVECAVGAAFVAPTTLPNFVKAELPVDVVKATDNGTTIDVNCVHSLPFEVSEDYASAHWYALKIRDDGFTYLSYDSSKEYIPASANAYSIKNLNNYLWAFIGNPFDGFKIINKAAGDAAILSAPVNPTGDRNANELVRMVAQGGVIGNEVWNLKKPTHNNAVDGVFYIEHPTATSYALNRQEYNAEKAVCYWNNRDTGSALKVEEVYDFSQFGDLLFSDEQMQEGKIYRIQSTTRKTFTGINGYTCDMQNQEYDATNPGQLWKYVKDGDKAYLQNVYSGLYPQKVKAEASNTTAIGISKDYPFTCSINNENVEHIWNIFFDGLQINVEANGNVNWWDGENAHHYIYEVEATDEELAAMCMNWYNVNKYVAPEATETYNKIDIDDNASVIISPNEFAAPSAINAAIDNLATINEDVLKVTVGNASDIHTLFGVLSVYVPAMKTLTPYKNAVKQYGELISIAYTPKAEWGTIILPINWAKPEGWTRYSCAATEGNVLTLTEYAENKTKNAPMIIQVAEDKIGTTYQLIGYSTGAATTNQTAGLLTGVLEDNTKVPAGSYVLARQKSTGKIGFFPVAEGADYGLEKYKCYLTLPVESARYNALFFEGGETAIENAEGAESAAKAVVYDLAGRRVQNAQKGVFIVNGKVVIK